MDSKSSKSASIWESPLLKPFFQIFAFLGRRLIDTFQMLTLLFEAFYKSFYPPFGYREFSGQLIAIGFNTIFVVIATAFFTGAALALMVAGTFSQKVDHVTVLNGLFGGYGMFTAIGPVLTALITTGKTGSGIAAEVGTMKITEQIDALRTLGTDPVKYLVTPRLWAAIISLPVLTVIADIAGVLGSIVVTIFQIGHTLENFMDEFQQGTTFEQFGIGLIKATTFGIIIAMVSSHEGFKTTGGAEGVGRASTNAVVRSSIWILAANYFLTLFLEGN